MKYLHPSRRSRAAGQAVKFVALAALLAGGVVTAAQAAPSGLSVSHPWMRVIMPSRPAAGYFTLSNASAKQHMLVAASSPACGMLMLHQSIRENGQEKMVMRKSIKVPAHGSVHFAPGGYHLMCMSPGKDVAKGHSVPITLRFADGSTLVADFPVRGAMGK